MDARRKGPDGHVVALHRDGNVAVRHRLLAIVAEVCRGAEHVRHQLGVCGDALRDEVRRRLCVTHLVGGDERQERAELRFLRLLAEAAKEVRGEMLTEHELDERRDGIAAIEVAAVGALPDLTQLVVGDAGLVPDGVEVHAQRVEVLEALVHLQREDDTGVDIIPCEADESREVHRMERLDEGGVAQLGEDLRLRQRSRGVDLAPANVALHTPRPAVGGAGMARIERTGRRNRLSHVAPPVSPQPRRSWATRRHTVRA